MKTAILTAPGRIEIRESGVPKIQNGDDVLLRTALVGICGSDLHYFSEPRVGDLDLVFECCGQQEAIDQAVRLLKPGGTIIMVGIPLEERISFDTSRLRRKELRVQNVRRQNHCLDRALGLMATHTFPFGRVQEAFETVFDHRDGVIKAMIAIEG